MILSLKRACVMVGASFSLSLYWFPNINCNLLAGINKLKPFKWLLVNNTEKDYRTLGLLTSLSEFSCSE